MLTSNMLDEMVRLRNEKTKLQVACNRLQEENQSLRDDQEQQDIEVLERHYRQLEAHRLLVLAEEEEEDNTAATANIAAAGMPTTTAAATPPTRRVEHGDDDEDRGDDDAGSGGSGGSLHSSASTAGTCLEGYDDSRCDTNCTSTSLARTTMRPPRTPAAADELKRDDAALKRRIADVATPRKGRARRASFPQGRTDALAGISAESFLIGSPRPPADAGSVVTGVDDLAATEERLSLEERLFREHRLLSAGTRSRIDEMPLPR
jgi:hypothetical protein